MFFNNIAIHQKKVESGRYTELIVSNKVFPTTYSTDIYILAKL